MLVLMLVMPNVVVVVVVVWFVVSPSLLPTLNALKVTIIITVDLN